MAEGALAERSCNFTTRRYSPGSQCSAPTQFTPLIAHLRAALPKRKSRLPGQADPIQPAHDSGPLQHSVSGPPARRQERLLPSCTALATPLSQPCHAANAAIPSQPAAEDWEDFSSASLPGDCSWPAAESTSLAASQEDGSYHASWHSPTKGCHWGSVYHLQAKH